GKSFFSLNLGLTMALTKKRTIVLEFDLRKPKLTERLGLSSEGGISSYLAGLEPLDKVIKPSGLHDQLFIANCGPLPPNPGELLLLPTVKTLIEELKNYFDYILIDSAPV